jgi:hypothetical protein
MPPAAKRKPSKMGSVLARRPSISITRRRRKNKSF